MKTLPGPNVNIANRMQARKLLCWSGLLRVLQEWREGSAYEEEKE